MTTLPAITEPSQLTLSQPFRTFIHEDEEGQSGIFARLRRRRLAFLGIFVLLLALVGAVYSIMPRSYRGQANVIIASAEPVLAPEGGAVVDQKLGDPADVEGQVVLLDSINLLKNVATDPTIGRLIKKECRIKKTQVIDEVVGLLVNFGVFTATDCDAYAASSTAIAGYLQDRLTIGENGKSRVINVSYSSPVAEASEKIPNAVVDAFITMKLQSKLDSRLAAVTWLHAEVDRISNDLADTEVRIDAFHREHGLVHGQIASFDSEQLTAIDQQLAIAQATQADAASKLIQLGSGAATAHATLESRVIGDIKQRLADVIRQQADLQSSHGASYPGVASLMQQRESLTAELNSETSRVAASLRQDYAAAREQVASLDRQLDVAKRQVAAGTNAETTIASLERHADVQRELYVDLAKKIDALETERRVVTGNAQVVSYAQLPDKIAFPRKLPFILGGLMIAAGLSLGTTLMLDNNDKTVRTKRGLQVASGVPVLGYIPGLRREQLAACNQVGTDPALQEAIRIIYAQSILVHDGTRPRSVLVTSALSGEGKTFVTLALAQFVARSGQRVLAIEGDMRRPDFHRALTLTKTPGLSDYLRGRSMCEEVIQHSQVTGLDVVTAGDPTPDSTELISNQRLNDLLNWAKGRYDLIVIDSPPAHALMDSRLLAGSVDGVLFCARWGRSTTQEVSDAVQDLVQHGVRVLGVVIDRVNTHRLRLYDKSSRYGISYQPRIT